MQRASNPHRIIQASAISAPAIALAGWMLTAWASTVRPRLGVPGLEAERLTWDGSALLEPGVIDAAEPFFIVSAASFVAGTLVWQWSPYLPRSGQIALWLLGNALGIAIGFHVAQPAGHAALVVLASATGGACAIGWLAAGWLESIRVALHTWRAARA